MSRRSVVDTNYVYITALLLVCKENNSVFAPYQITDLTSPIILFAVR